MKMTGNGGPRRFELAAGVRSIVVLNANKFGFELDGVVYTITRTGLFAPNYHLVCDQELMLTAEQRPLFAQYAIAHAGGQWIFKTISLGQTMFILQRGADRVGLISPGGWWSFYKNIAIDISDEMSLPAQVFLVWLALRHWQE
jgi:hypothetical protein